MMAYNVLNNNDLIEYIATFMSPMTRSIACRVNKQFHNVIVKLSLSKKLTTTLYTCCHNHLLHSKTYMYSRSDSYPYAIEVSASSVHKIIGKPDSLNNEYVKVALDKIFPVEYLSDYHLFVRNMDKIKHIDIPTICNEIGLEKLDVDIDIAKKYVSRSQYVDKFVFALYRTGVEFIDVKSSFMYIRNDDFAKIIGAACGAAAAGRLNTVSAIIQDILTTPGQIDAQLGCSLLCCGAIHGAIYGNNMDIFAYLLTNISNKQMLINIIELVILSAAKKGNCKAIKLIAERLDNIVSYGVIKDSINGAIIYGHIASIDTLIQLLPDKKITEEFLTFACKYGTVESVEHLLQLVGSSDITMLAKYPAMQHRADIVNCLQSHGEINMEMISEVLNSH